MYAPVIGRFVNEDPIGFDSEESNFYRYVGNNPVNKTDPSGLTEEDADQERAKELRRALGDLKLDLDRLSMERVNTLMEEGNAERQMVATGHGPITALVVRQKISNDKHVVFVYQYIGRAILWGDGNYYSLSAILPERYTNETALSFVIDAGLEAQQSAVTVEWTAVLHLIPLAAATDYLQQAAATSDAERRNALLRDAGISAIGDLTLGLGAVARTLKNSPKLAKILSGIAITGEGAVAGVRSVTAYDKFQKGDLSGAAGDIAEALLRAAGVALQFKSAPKPRNLPEKFVAPSPVRGSTADFEHFVQENKGIIANLDKDGLVQFKINTEGSGVRGTDLFNRMMEHFGENAKGVWGKWVSGTNLDTVNKLTGERVPFHEAVSRTWTANRARDAGFGTANIITVSGSPGAYTNIEVKFTK